MSNIDHSGATVIGAAQPLDTRRLESRVNDLVRLLDFIAKKEPVTVEVSATAPTVTIEMPKALPPQVAVPITVPMPTVNVANNIDSRWPRILAWLVAGDIIMKVAGLAWQMASTMK